jgi:spore coat polysaccharide biosynthesis protein SpsF (cytidylyltransferase family)
MKILAITQARIGSTRLPEKILKTINGESLLEIHLKRILKSSLITKLKVATTIEPDAEKIVTVCKRLGIEVNKGSINNVLERFYETALPENPDWVVRLTSDCPLIDAVEIDRVIKYAIDNDFDYASNALKPTYPDGIDTEVFKFSALQKAMKEATLTSELEHVTPYIQKNSSFNGGHLFTSGCVMNDVDYSELRLTVDTLEDFQVIEKLVELLGSDKPWIEYVKAMEKHPDIKKINEHFRRNEGYEKSINKDKIA